jgi:Uma2 family endonuclease
VCIEVGTGTMRPGIIHTLYILSHVTISRRPAGKQISKEWRCVLQRAAPSVKLFRMQALAERYITEEEYWTLEEQSEVKHEYFNGEIFAMAGGTPEHAALAMNAGISLGSQLRGKPCRVAGSDQRVKVEATGLITYPDAVVYCQPYQFDPLNKNTLLNPVVLIEVLSDSTENYDRTIKFDHYKQIESLHDYILIEQDQVRVEHFRRTESGEWLHRAETTLGASITLNSIGCTVSLAELYENIELPATVPLREPTPEPEP